jgi:hypothetical protein
MVEARNDSFLVLLPGMFWNIRYLRMNIYYFCLPTLHLVRLLFVFALAIWTVSTVGTAFSACNGTVLS